MQTCFNLIFVLAAISANFHCIPLSIAEPHHFYAAPAPGENFDAAPAPTLPYIKATLF
jgi:hypothetical protein